MTSKKGVLLRISAVGLCVLGCVLLNLTLHTNFIIRKNSNDYINSDSSSKNCLVLGLGVGTFRV